MPNQLENKNHFNRIWMNYVKRENSEKIPEMLDRTDFFDAPASVKYHCNFDGGLCEHTLRLYGFRRRIVCESHSNSWV